MINNNMSFVECKINNFMPHIYIFFSQEVHFPVFFVTQDVFIHKNM